MVFVSSLSLSDGLSKYLMEISKFPVLSASEENDLARSLVEKGDRDAAHALVTSHLRLAASIAMQYKGYGLPMQEVIGEANVGLMKAVKKFDPSKGFRLSTYAVWWIRASIQEYVLRFWSVVKVGSSAAQKRLFFNLRRLKRKIRSFHKGEVMNSGAVRPDEAEEIAEVLGVNTSEVVDMDARLEGKSDLSLNVSVSNKDSSDSGAEMQDLLEDGSDSHSSAFEDAQELSMRRNLLGKAMDECLSDRDRDIFISRRLLDPPKTLEMLSLKYGVSRERIRQLEERAFNRVSVKVRDMEKALFNSDDDNTLLALPSAAV